MSSDRGITGYRYYEGGCGRDGEEALTGKGEGKQFRGGGDKEH